MESKMAKTAASTSKKSPVASRRKTTGSKTATVSKTQPDQRRRQISVAELQSPPHKSWWQYPAVKSLLVLTLLILLFLLNLLIFSDRLDAVMLAWGIEMTLLALTGWLVYIFKQHNSGG
ncbi:hypothetical protein HCH52_00670 [Oscillospiraceae bacterium HV4-5-C5C]|nr:hypothetical protein [Oscillospiraceae bacterium HV4-5-C5C]